MVQVYSLSCEFLLEDLPEELLLLELRELELLELELLLLELLLLEFLEFEFVFLLSVMFSTTFRAYYLRSFTLYKRTSQGIFCRLLRREVVFFFQ